MKNFVQVFRGAIVCLLFASLTPITAEAGRGFVRRFLPFVAASTITACTSTSDHAHHREPLPRTANPYARVIRVTERATPARSIEEPEISAAITGKVSTDFHDWNTSRLRDVMAEQVSDTAQVDLVSFGRASSLLSSVRGEWAVQHQKTAFDTTCVHGHCFNRALVAHTLEVLSNPSVPMAKVFVQGSLQSGSTFWSFHVAAMAPAAEGGWWVIDTLASKPLKLDQWVEFIRTRYHATPETRIYVAEPINYTTDSTYHTFTGNSSADVDNEGFVNRFLSDHGL